MNTFNTLGTLIDRPELLGGQEAPAGLGEAGMLGYGAGTLGLFVFLRMHGAVPPGALSFAIVLTLVLALNYFMAAVIHLFMDLTGAGGSAGRLFEAFGLSDYLLTALVPLAFLAKLGVLGPFISLLLCALLVIYARVRLVKRVYPVSGNKAALSVLLPYAGLAAAGIMASVYFSVWLVWLAMGM